MRVIYCQAVCNRSTLYHFLVFCSLSILYAIIGIIECFHWISRRPEDLRIPFERFGPVKDVYLPKNYYTGYGRFRVNLCALGC